MFKIYDLNFKEVSLPAERLGYGMKALDISIGPRSEEHTSELSHNNQSRMPSSA